MTKGLPTDMSKVPPAAMFRLPADRPSNNGGGPIIEPSQQFCPHWLLVVAHQAVREIYYMSSDVQRQLCGGCIASTVYRPVGIKKRVLFVRHGQGAHNQTIANWGLVDPELTAEGEAQVATLHEELLNPDLNPEGVEGIELIAVSPLTRAMQTATGGFAGLRVPYVVTPLLRERLGAPCDTGRTRTELLRCFPKMMEWEGIDELPELWWSTETEYDLLGRIDELKRWILTRPETTIAVVGHGGLFSRILGYHLKNCGFKWHDVGP